MRNEKGKVKVTLQIFSGRPDPEWELTEEQIDKLKKLLKSVPKIEKVGMNMVPEGGLGYQGFTIHSERENIPVQITVFQNRLILTEVGTKRLRGKQMQIKRIYHDKNKLEEWLLKQAEEHGYGEALKVFSVRKKEFVIAKCAEGLGLFDQECKDKEGKGYPIITDQACKAIDTCGIQAHAGYYMIGSGGNEFEFDIDKYPILYLTMKAEKDTDTCLLLLVHEKEPRDFMRRFAVIGTTDSEKKHCGVRPAEDCFTIEDDNEWQDYTYDLRKLREAGYPDAKTVRIVQFYSGKLCNGIPHTFHFRSLVFKK